MHRCHVCKKRIWLFPVRVVIKLPDKTREYWVHEGCLGKLELELEALAG